MQIFSEYNLGSSQYMNTYKNANIPTFDANCLIKEKECTQEEAIKKSDYNEKAFFSVGANAPESVKKAWLEAANETGANGLGMLQNGMLGHISQMTVHRFYAWHNNENCSDILGNTVESAIKATEKALYDLDNPLDPNEKKSIEVQKLRMQERQFYTAFLDKICNL